MLIVYRWLRLAWLIGDHYGLINGVLAISDLVKDDVNPLNKPE